MLFSIPVLLIALGLEIAYRHIPTNYTVKKEHLDKYSPTIETLILGDSHALYGINPSIFTTTSYNLSQVSQSLYQDFLLFEAHKKRLPKLKNIILTVGYYSLSQKENAAEDSWRRFFYHHQMKLDIPSVRSWYPQYYSMALIRRFDQSIKHISTYIFGDSLVTIDSLGWGINYKGHHPESLQKLAPHTASKHEDGLMDFTKNSSYLEEVIKYCQSKNINVFLVEMPVYKGYLELLDSNKVKKIERELEDLSIGNHNTSYLDLKQHPDLEFDDFYDPDHLNQNGALKISKLINSFINYSKKL